MDRKVLFFATILILFTMLNLQAQDSVAVTFKITVPEETPESDQIFWAGSLNYWDPGNKGSGFGAGDHSRSASFDNGIWSLQIKAPKNSKETYKYTRGSFFSVEEEYDYSYLPTRAITFDENKTVYDTVEAWHDIPPQSLSQQWPTVKLEKAKSPTLAYEGKTFTGGSTILYAKDSIRRFYGDKLNDEVKFIPEFLSDTVAYFHKTSRSQDDTILILAGRETKDKPWDIYIDQDNNNGIQEEEFAFTIKSDKTRITWSDNVKVQTLHNGSEVSSKAKLTVNFAPDFLEGYSSSIRSEAPNLSSKLPLKHKKGVLNGENFYLHTQFHVAFSRYFWLTVDHNRNDTLEIGSGSDEVSEIDHGQIYQKQKFFIHPSFKLGDQYWTVASIDPEGDYIRLRPSQNQESSTKIIKGEPAPSWNATTANGKTTSSETLAGKYVLIDFWGSWCGPCLDEIPTLKKAYNRFESDKFELIGFAYDSESAFKQVMKNYDIPWPQVLDDKGNYSTKFLVKGYPTHYLIGPDGDILETGNALRSKNLISTLEKYLK